MDGKKTYLISDASRKVEVESHVLRYWEDELKLPVKRNELGHRYYTEEDIMEFQGIKKLKEQGFQLKAIRMILKNGKLTRLSEPGGLTAQELKRMEEEKMVPAEISAEAQSAQPLAEAQSAQPLAEAQSAQPLAEAQSAQPLALQDAAVQDQDAEEKGKRLEYLMKKLISEAVEESNEKFYGELTETLTKELDYQFRMQEEREEQRENRRLAREEEHYKQLDELLRGKSGRKKREDQGGKERGWLFRKAKKVDC